jgi:hypothetical protein
LKHVKGAGSAIPGNGDAIGLLLRRKNDWRLRRGTAERPAAKERQQQRSEGKPTATISNATWLSHKGIYGKSVL